MKSIRPRAGHLAGLFVSAALVAAAGSAQAAAFVGALGLTVAADAQGQIATRGYNFTQPSPFTNLDESLFHESSDHTGAQTDMRSAVLLSADFTHVFTQTGASAIRLGNSFEPGTSTVTGFAETSLHDALTVTGGASAPDQVVIHRLLEVSGRAAGAEFLEFLGDHIEGTTSVTLLSNNVSAAELGPSRFIDFAFNSVNDDVTTSGTDNFLRFVDFSVIATLNQVTNIDLALLNQFDFHLTDVDGDAPRGNDNLQGDIFASAFALFQGDVRITDTAGNAVCGVTIQADSGTDWGSTPACQGGGGGGGAGGVPEPATWSLMIGGFGLAGAALRRKRRAPRAYSGGWLTR